MRRTPLLLLTLALAGCAGFSGDGGQAGVHTLVQERGGPAPGRARLADLLAAPLTADTAVAIALLNNRALQAGYAELGIVEADLVQAGRIQNPTFTFGKLKDHQGVEYERKLMLPVIGLLTMPVARRIEQRRFEQAQMRAAGEVLRIADETRRAYFGAVAAQ
ncbi:MAG: hypothetical protein V4633_18305 [Pseudomonadota bacterium]